MHLVATTEVFGDSSISCQQVINPPSVTLPVGEHEAGVGPAVHRRAAANDERGGYTWGYTRGHTRGYDIGELSGG